MSIKLYQTITDYEAANISTPNVSFIVENNELFYNASLPKTPVSVFPEKEFLKNKTYLELSYKKLFNSGLNTYYYNDLNTIINDINLGENSCTELEALFYVYVKNDIINIVLLNDIIISSTVLFNNSNSYNLILNGFGITINTDCGFSITNKSIINIDGNCINSNIYITNDEGVKTEMFYINDGELYINGGKYSSLSHNYGTTDNPNKVINVENGKLSLNNLSIVTTDDNNGPISSVFIDENSLLDSNDITIESISAGGLRTVGITSYGNSILKNSVICAYANHTANSAGTDYGTTSNAIAAYTGNIELYNCYIYGMHSGMLCKCECKIDGGIYSGYSHGGCYFSADSKSIYLKNASFLEKDLPENFIDDGIAGTNNAALYIGGAPSMSIYVDNCNFYAKAQPIVLKHGGSSHTHKIYLSNTNINLNYSHYGFRNDGNNEVYIGVGNNFTYNNLKYNHNYFETEEEYK